MTAASPRARRALRAAAVVCAVLLAIVLAPVLIVRLFADTRGER